ncbi:winged helix-turn-helix domain-containing protein [Phytoactinopolyspora alkaliphila]|uniref:winged helix-turn-helix domain-containing protein n=1 Tax=Phytoactinopolyspora alkaliphila TaxID=1783498 RepID=UPI001C209CEF
MIDYTARHDIPAFNPDDAGPGYLYVRVADHITARIDVGELRPGARIPGERDLAAEYGVSLGTIRKTARVLRARGLVITLRHKGTYIRHPDARNATTHDSGTGGRGHFEPFPS